MKMYKLEKFQNLTIVGEACIDKEYNSNTKAYDTFTNLLYKFRDELVNKQGKYYPKRCEFARLKNGYFLGVYIDKDLKNNPYFVIYNNKTKEYSFTMDFELVKMFTNENFAYSVFDIFQSGLEHNKELYFNLNDIKDKIQPLAKSFDDDLER